MFADPIANVTYNAVAQTMPRVSQSGQKSVYRKSDGSLVITVSHQVTGANKVRSMFRIDRNVDVNSDLVLDTESGYVVLERPLLGFTETDAINLLTCLFGALTGGSNDGIKKLNGQES